MPNVDNVLGVVLVGGASRRFGSDKAAAMFRGKTLFAHSLHILHEAGLRNLAYVGGARRTDVAFGATHVSDVPDAEQCTLRGVVAALQFASSRWQRVMMLACDIPLVHSATVSKVISALDTHDAGVASAERDHWSCLAVRSSVLPELRTSLYGADRSMHRAFATLNVENVRVNEAEFVNVNTPDDLAVIITNETNVRG